jgi:hypothetical protein
MKKEKSESKRIHASGEAWTANNAEDPGRLRRRRRFQTSKAVAAIPCIQHILDAKRLTWPDVGLHPDCLFAMLAFIHASQQQEPTCDLIIDTRRKSRNWLRLDPPDDFFPEAWTKRCNEYSIWKREGRVMNAPYAV